LRQLSSPRSPCPLDSPEVFDVAMDEMSQRSQRIGITPLLFPSPEGKLLHLDNFRYRKWTPAIKAGGIQRPARLYDLRSTFASNALAAGIAVFELAKVMGTSVEMIERHYGSLFDGSAASIASRRGAFERLGRESVADSDAGSQNR